MDYIVVTPAKDEERHIERTLMSMTSQLRPPTAWVIVDDGSSDGTAEIVARYAQAHTFIRLLRLPKGRPRKTGTAEIVAFKLGLESLSGVPYGFVAKLDADLSFEGDYFAQLLDRFQQHPRLGIASGLYFEDHGRGWKPIGMPSYHAAGASKVLRRECFEAIDGFIVERGWDTVDEIRAIARGWDTAHFPDLRLCHWKPEGKSMGMLRTNFMHGEIYYRTGGGLLFFLLKVLRRTLSPPLITGALATLCGFADAAMRRSPMLVTPHEAKIYRRLLNARMRFGGAAG
jgi:biofilm PGA synthesis N-glycosyltransferase PgaC